MADKTPVGAHDTRQLLKELGTVNGVTVYAPVVAVVDAPGAAAGVSTPLGSQSITVTGTAATLASLCTGAALPTGATWAWLQPRGGDIYMTDLASNTPTTGGVGLKIAQDQMFPLLNGLSGVKLVASGSTAVTVNFYR